MQGSSCWKPTQSHRSSWLCLVFSEVGPCPRPVFNVNTPIMRMVYCTNPVNCNSLFPLFESDLLTESWHKNQNHNYLRTICFCCCCCRQFCLELNGLAVKLQVSDSSALWAYLFVVNFILKLCMIRSNILVDLNKVFQVIHISVYHSWVEKKSVCSHL